METSSSEPHGDENRRRSNPGKQATPRPDAFSPGLDANAYPGAVGPSLGAEGLVPARSRPHRRGAGSGLFGQLLGIVVSGVLGLALGYYLLNWWGGPAYNFLDIPLPGLPPAPHAIAEPRAVAPPPGAIVAEQPLPRLPAVQEPAAQSATEQPAIAELATRADAGPQLPRDYVGPRHFTVRHLEELNDALLAAKALLICDRCKSTGYVLDGDREQSKAARRVSCDQCGGRTGRPLTADGYATLCQLAEVVTFAELEPNEAVSIRRREALRALLLRATSDERKSAAIGRKASSHLVATDRTTTGLLIAGTVLETSREGKLTLVKILLPETNELVVVASRVGLPAQVGDRLGVLGSIVEQSDEQLIGYNGDLPVVVWSGFATRLTGP